MPVFQYHNSPHKTLKNKSHNQELVLSMPSYKHYEVFMLLENTIVFQVLYEIHFVTQYNYFQLV